MKKEKLKVRLIDDEQVFGNISDYAAGLTTGSGGCGGSGSGSGSKEYGNSCSLMGSTSFEGVTWDITGSAFCIAIVENGYIKDVSANYSIALNGGIVYSSDKDGNPIVCAGNKIVIGRTGCGESYSETVKLVVTKRTYDKETQKLIESNAEEEERTVTATVDASFNLVTKELSVTGSVSVS